MNGQAYPKSTLTAPFEAKVVVEAAAEEVVVVGLLPAGLPEGQTFEHAVRF